MTRSSNSTANITPGYWKLYLPGLLLGNILNVSESNALNAAGGERKRLTWAMTKSWETSPQLCSNEMRLGWLADLFCRVRFAYLNPELESPGEAESHHPAFIHSLNTNTLNDLYMLCSFHGVRDKPKNKKTNKKTSVFLLTKYLKVLKGISCQHVANKANTEPLHLTD